MIDLVQYARSINIIIKITSLIIFSRKKRKEKEKRKINKTRDNKSEIETYRKLVLYVILKIPFGNQRVEFIF